ncbi:MAG TPA: response regulator transcription factor [Puia sp.]|nr:response regulator transcription factor [Puia sp.]
MNENEKIIKIALVDDHTLIRDAIAVVINSFENCQVTLTAGNGKELIEKMHSGNVPDLLILDLNMPLMDGFETSKWVRNEYPEMLVLVLTMYDSELSLIRLLQSGVRGFLKKDIHPRELRSAIETTVKTGYYYSGNATGKIVNMLKNGETNTPVVNTIILSENELSFLKLSATDKTYKEIANEMKISPRTVDNYRDSLFLKLNVKSRVGLVMYAIKNGVIAPGY